MQAGSIVRRNYPGSDQQGIARQEKADKQAGLDEDDAANHYQPAAKRHDGSDVG